MLQSITLSAPERPIRSPLAVHCRGSVELSDLVAERPELIAEWLLEHGAVLFRGFAADSVERFEKFAAALALRRSDYLYRSTPRTAVGDRIFTATEYPADREIPLHNENAYQRAWPLKVGFCCVTPHIRVARLLLRTCASYASRRGGARRKVRRASHSVRPPLPTVR